jgi:multiple sugar transport system permease protein
LLRFAATGREREDLKGDVSMLMRRNHARRHALLIAVTLVQLMIVIVMIVPLAYMLSTSFKRNMDIYVFPLRWIPRPFVLIGYIEALKDLHILLLFRNSLLVAVAAVAISLFVNALAGYSFARKSFPAKNALFLVVLSSMMVPFQAILIPLFLIIKGMGLYNTFAAIILPWSVNAYGIFLIRQYVTTIPDEFDYAAKIDGCPDFMIFTRIIIPLCKPILLSLGIFLFIWTWTDLLLPLIMTNSASLTTIELGLSQLGGKFGGTQINVPVAMAGCTIAILPPLLFFVLGGRTLMMGQLLQGGIKG